jgi:hypothetical protein
MGLKEKISFSGLKINDPTKYHRINPVAVIEKWRFLDF